MNPWIIYSQPKSSAHLRLFAFPHAGGGSGSFRGWANRLGDEIELGYVQLPGRESRFRESPYDSMAELISPLVDALLGHLDREFAFYGHSLGAKVAFEAMRELRRRGLREPAHLFVAACPAPQLPWPLPPMHGLATPEFLDEMQARYGGIPAEVREDDDLMALLLPTLRADIRMIETYAYTPEAPLKCGLTVFGGLEDPMVEEPSLAAWKLQTKSRFRLQMELGGHFFPQRTQSRFLESLAAELLDAARVDEKL